MVATYHMILAPLCPPWGWKAHDWPWCGIHLGVSVLPSCFNRLECDKGLLAVLNATLLELVLDFDSSVGLIHHTFCPFSLLHLEFFFNVVFLPLNIISCSCHNLLHRNGLLLDQEFVKVSDLKAVMERSNEHMLIWVGGFDVCSFNMVKYSRNDSEWLYETLNMLVVETFRCLLPEKSWTIFLVGYWQVITALMSHMRRAHWIFYPLAYTWVSHLLQW